MTASQIVFLAAFAPLFGGSLLWLAGHIAFVMEA